MKLVINTRVSILISLAFCWFLNFFHHRCVLHGILYHLRGDNDVLGVLLVEVDFFFDWLLEAHVFLIYFSGLLLILVLEHLLHHPPLLLHLLHVEICLEGILFFRAFLLFLNNWFLLFLHLLRVFLTLVL